MAEESLKDFNRPKPGDLDDILPNREKRNFNENDVLGDFDRDDKGNVIVLQDEDGNYVDKQGRVVNERGYLIDPKTGDIMEHTFGQKMFDHKDIDERGEIPAPFCVEKYNFNPFQIKGEFDYDKNGNSIITKNKQGDFVDKKGRKVNKKGWYTDKFGNITTKDGKKKFDRKQLTPDGDL